MRLSRFVLGMLPLLGVLAQTPPQTRAEVHFASGVKLFREGDLASAIKELRQSIALRPDFPQAHNTLGLLLGKQGADIEAVLFHFRKAIALQPDYAEAHYNVGLVLAQLGRIDECIAEFRAAIQANPKDPEPYNSLALTLVERNVEQAIDLYTQAITLKPDFVEAQFNLALAYRRKYGAEREIEQLKKTLALDADHLVARNTLTRRYEELGEYDEVARLASGTLQRHPNSGEAHYFAGKALIKAGNAAEGFAHLQRAVALEPELAEAHYHLALVLRKQGRREEADAALARSEALRQKQHRDINASIQMNQASLNLERGETGKAVEALRDVVNNQPDWPDAHFRLGFAQLRAGDEMHASSSLRKAIELDPNYFEPHYFLGLMALRASRFQQARDYLQTAVRLRPSSPEAHRALGDALALGGSRRLAEAEYRNALRIRPNDPATLYPLAKVLADQKKLAESRRMQERANELSRPAEARSQAIAALDEGNRKLQAGDLRAAIDQFRKAVSAAPDLPEARQFLGSALLSGGRVDEAIAELSKAGELRPAYFEAAYNLGLAYGQKGAFDAAIQHFRRALAQRENSAECHDSLGVALASKGEHQEAIREFRRAIELKPEWSLAHFHLGSALRLSGNVEAASRAFADARRLDPRMATGR